MSTNEHVCCGAGWVCRTHPNQPWPHGDCRAAIRCEDPACPFDGAPPADAADQQRQIASLRSNADRLLTLTSDHREQEIIRTVMRELDLARGRVDTAVPGRDQLLIESILVLAAHRLRQLSSTDRDDG